MTVRDARLAVVLLRGGLDGLAAVAPYGDPRLAALRPRLVLPEPGRERGLLDLGGTWGLHPALAHLHALYAAGEMLAIHAVAGPWRTRSHFEALNQLETGAARGTSGWLNRAVAELRPRVAFASALALGAVRPLILEGSARVGAWAPSRPLRPSDGFYDALAALCAPDRSIAAAVAERRFAADALGNAAPLGGAGFVEMASVAGRLLAATGGPRVALLELEGWDTHANQVGHLAGALRPLDQGIAALHAGLGAAWGETAVLVMTEFGRTVRGNGTGGSDHGTGGVAFVLGGCVAGGRVAGDWPGLADLLDDRDLPPTTDLHAVAASLLGGHLGLDTAALARVFPDGAPSATRGLLRH